MPVFREIERRFLIGPIPPDALAVPPREIEQGYLSVFPTTVRLRREESSLFLTVKQGPLEDHAEAEIVLDSAQFACLWPLTAGARIRKLRRSIPAGPNVIELDVFAGAHSGLVIAEVEFPDREAATAFVAPPWFGREITGNPDYSNGRLATES